MSLPELLQKRRSLRKQAREAIASIKDDSTAAEVRAAEREYEAIAAQLDEIGDQIEEARMDSKPDHRRPVLEDGEARMDTARSRLEGEFTVRVNGRDIPAIRSNQRVVDYVERSDDPGFSLGEFVRAGMGLEKRAVTSSSATVPEMLSSIIIDAVRAKSTIIRAGTPTILLSEPTRFARVTGDATVYEHTEGADDISESDPTFDSVAMDPKALVALVPLSAEVVEDSKNLDRALQTSLAAAFAQKLDSLSLATILADSDITNSTSNEDPATWAGVLAALGSMLGADMDVPASGIFNAADWVTLTGEQASTSGDWLGSPPALSQMLQLQTTKLDAGRAILGDFERAFAIGMRQDLRLEVARFHKASSYSHVLVAHMRADGFVMQPDALYAMNADVGT